LKIARIVAVLATLFGFVAAPFEGLFSLFVNALRVRILRVLAVCNALKNQVLLRFYSVWSARDLAWVAGQRRIGSTAINAGIEIVILIVFLAIALYVAAYTVPGALTAMATSALTSVNTGVQTLFQTVVSLIAVVALILLLIGVVRKVFM
jgi:flagellar biosynthesis protein FlhB